MGGEKFPGVFARLVTVLVTQMVFRKRDVIHHNRPHCIGKRGVVFFIKLLLEVAAHQRTATDYR